MLRNKNLFLTSQGLICPDRIIPASFGKGGISKRPKEHEPTTPTGEHTIIGMLYRPDRLKNQEIGQCRYLLIHFGPTTREIRIII